MDFSIDVEGWERIFKRILNWEARLEKSEQVLSAISFILEDSIIQNYFSVGRPETWPRRKNHYPWSMLWKSGKKRETEIESAKGKWAKVGDGWQLDVYSTYYGYYHQYGEGQKIRKAVKVQNEELEQMGLKLLDFFE